MGVKHTTKKNLIPKMQKQIELVKGEAVEAGVLEGEHKWLAGIHEYGCDIEVTPKMRAYLHRQGLHLSPSTTRIKIPERSFLRTGYDEHRNKVLKKASKMLAAVSAGEMSANDCFKGVGVELSSKIKDYALHLKIPENHPFTVEQKGDNNPLIGHKSTDEGGSGAGGQMIAGITWRKAK